MSRFRFTQADVQLAELEGETHLLRALEGAPGFARLSADAGPLSADLDYSLDLLTDTGAVREHYGALMLVAFDVPADRTAEVARWYDDEHIMLLMRADGWLRARRFDVVAHHGKSWTSLAFHELRDVSVMESEERHIARSTPWRSELELETWFKGAGRWVYVQSA